MINSFRHAATAAVGLAALALLTLPAIGNAAPANSTNYVSPTGVNTNDNSSCAQAAFSSIQAAVTAEPSGGTVFVCAGTYAEGVTVDKPLTLIGQDAVINASGQPYGIGLAASYSTVSGFTVRKAHADESTGAPGDGIVTAGIVASTLSPSDHDVITGNTLARNDGSGIDVESSSFTTISGNVSVRNGIGINVTNDLGAPSAHDVIAGNTTNNNPGGCGIVLADHSGSGVFDNRVLGNTARDNGLGTPSAPNASSGSGIIIAAAGATGGAYNNLIRGNTLTGNGHGGVALHGHAPGPKFSGNQIVGNTIGKNNLRTDYRDKQSTGIYLGDVAKLRIAVWNNLFRNDRYGVFTAGPVKVVSLKKNAFVHVKVHHKQIAKYAG
jgi:parallel beta-helix repeat protein